jgi:SAM-dependent methyltransferase
MIYSYRNRRLVISLQTRTGNKMNAPADSAEIKNTLLETVSCDFCGGSDSTMFIRPDKFPVEMPQRPVVVRCGSCGFLYTNPRPRRNFLTELYRRYYPEEKSNGSSLSTAVKKNTHLRKLWHLYCGQFLGRALAEACGRVLDLGCGTGGLLMELQQKGCECYGVELNPDSVSRCIRRGLRVKCGDLDDFHFEDGFFDTIVLWHVLEHLPSPATALSNCRRMLKPGGKILIYSPNAHSYLAAAFKESWFPWQVPFHFSHFTPSSIKAYAGKCGLLARKIKAVTPEYYFAYSIDQICRTHRHPMLCGFSRRGVFRSLAFRIAVAAFFRILDLAFPGRGECLQVQLIKPSNG